MKAKLRGVATEFAERSDPGRDPTKQVNEDSSGRAETALGLLAVVCDGMGGHVGGKAASETAVATILRHVRGLSPATDPCEGLRDAVAHAARAVYEVGGDTPVEMRPGSTCVAVLVHDGVAEVAHVGDSRVYLLRSQELHRLTRDHSMVQQMVDAGVITPEQAVGHPDANRITRALGMMPEVEVEVSSPAVPVFPGDLLLLCSDGLSDLLDDSDILAVVREWLPRGLTEVCSRLVEMANACGGYDNITVQVLRILDARQPLSPTIVEETPPSVPGAPSSQDGAGTHPMSAAEVAEPASAPRARPAPTLIEEPSEFTSRRANNQAAGASDGAGLGTRTRPSVLPVRKPDSRLLILVALSVAVLVVIGVAIWWLLVDEGTPVLVGGHAHQTTALAASTELAGTVPSPSWATPEPLRIESTPGVIATATSPASVDSR